MSILVTDNTRKNDELIFRASTDNSKNFGPVLLHLATNGTIGGSTVEIYNPSISSCSAPLYLM